jgi:Bacterial SH3 domain
MKLSTRLLAGAAALLFTTGVAVAATVVADANLNLRSGPGTQFPVIAVIPDGAPVSATRCADGWCRVDYRGEAGWASTAYLTGATVAVAPYGYSYSYTEPYYEPYYYGGFGFGPELGFGGYFGHHHFRHFRHHHFAGGNFQHHFAGGNFQHHFVGGNFQHRFAGGHFHQFHHFAAGNFPHHSPGNHGPIGHLAITGGPNFPHHGPGNHGPIGHTAIAGGPAVTHMGAPGGGHMAAPGAAAGGHAGPVPGGIGHHH